MNDPKTSGVRKPYKISKPREKWTETEHDRFVKAITRYGRDWKRIVSEVGTRTVAQVRSHAQKYFLKLEKTGNVEDVPPARAKRPSTKPYPVKGAGEEGSSASGQSTGMQEPRRPRRTERVSTRPNRDQYTNYEDETQLSPEPGSSNEEALTQRAEGNGSNIRNDVSGSAESFNEPHDPNGSVLSSQYRRLSSMQSIPQLTHDYSSTLYPAEYSKQPSNPASATEDSCMAPIVSDKLLPDDAPDYNDLYDVVGRLYDSQQAQAATMNQLRASQRMELSHRMEHLSGHLRNGLEHMPSSDSPPIDLNSHLDGPYSTQTFPQEVPGLNLLHSASPDFVEMESIPDVPETPANTQGTGLLPSCTKPSELDHSGWQLAGMSGDLNSILHNSMLPHTQDSMLAHNSGRLDAGIFDY